MAVADPPAGAPFNPRRAWVIFMLFLGLLSLAAVREAKVECQAEYLTADDGVTRLTADDGVTLLTTGRQQCRVEVGDLRVQLPPLGARDLWISVRLALAGVLT
jgi:hypothetical protein